MLNSSRFLLLAFLVLSAGGTTYAFSVPAYEGFVTDRTGTLNSTEKQELETVLTTYRAETSNEIAILLVGTLDGEAIADVAVEVGRKWGLGRNDVHNGILILAAIDDREIFIATGYGLEGAVPDLLASQIIESEITPQFRNGNYFAGLLSGVTALQSAIGGEYEPTLTSGTSDINMMNALLWFMFFVFPWLGAILGRTKSWWLGGVIGAIGGAVLWLMTFTVFAIPFFALLGLLFDFIVSKNFKSGRRHNPWYVGGGWGPGGGSSGGFGGFGGGSFGGGGAGGKW
ncbi:methanol dehydrogenase [Candidatus Peregrinibacteria bacterium CG10_big_fil_rev_8_21_14_0_10_42_8]|nr:MAG: methanol dehydrogenase [Candidatus Peregrinibacteria bacterium CG10_big_fil_rev_8_21_14_0_10_42_8]